MHQREQQEYLAQRNLLLSNPQASWDHAVQIHIHTAQPTKQQEKLLQKMDPQQKSLYIHKLQKDIKAQRRA